MTSRDLQDPDKISQSVNHIAVHAHTNNTYYQTRILQVNNTLLSMGKFNPQTIALNLFNQTTIVLDIPLVNCERAYNPETPYNFSEIYQSGIVLAE